MSRTYRRKNAWDTQKYISGNWDWDWWETPPETPKKAKIKWHKDSPVKFKLPKKHLNSKLRAKNKQEIARSKEDTPQLTSKREILSMWVYMID